MVFHFWDPYLADPLGSIAPLAHIYAYRNRSSLQLLQAPFSLVEGSDVLQLEAQRLGPGEAHGEEHEAVPVHLVGSILTDAEADTDGNLNAGESSCNGRIEVDQGVDRLEDVVVLLPEVGGDVLAGGKHAAIRGVNDGGDGGINKSKPGLHDRTVSTPSKMLSAQTELLDVARNIDDFEDNIHSNMVRLFGFPVQASGH